MTKPKSKTKKKQQDNPLPSEVLRAFIRQQLDSGVSIYRIAANAGVNWATVYRFMNGERLLSLASFDELCRSLGLELRSRRTGKLFTLFPRDATAKEIVAG